MLDRTQEDRKQTLLGQTAEAQQRSSLSDWQGISSQPMFRRHADVRARTGHGVALRAVRSAAAVPYCTLCMPGHANQHTVQYSCDRETKVEHFSHVSLLFVKQDITVPSPRLMPYWYLYGCYIFCRGVRQLHTDHVRFSYNSYFSICIFSRNNIFLSQQISRNSV